VPAAWIQGTSFGVCFKSVASFYHPQYLSRTSPLSIHCAWNSRIWHFYLNNTFLPWRNLWNLVFATLKPESMKLTCQFRRFLARTFRPVGFRGFRDIVRRTISSMRWTTLLDIRDRFRRCPERDRILFLWIGGTKNKRGEQNTSQKNENRGISGFSQLHVCQTRRHSEPVILV